eukprot:1865682-Rhodomonas_salina.1
MKGRGADRPDACRHELASSEGSRRVRREEVPDVGSQRRVLEVQLAADRKLWPDHAPFDVDLLARRRRLGRVGVPPKVAAQPDSVDDPRRPAPH